VRSAFKLSSERSGRIRPSLKHPRSHNGDLTSTSLLPALPDPTSRQVRGPIIAQFRRLSWCELSKDRLCCMQPRQCFRRRRLTKREPMDDPATQQGSDNVACNATLDKPPLCCLTVRDATSKYLDSTKCQTTGIYAYACCCTLPLRMTWRCIAASRYRYLPAAGDDLASIRLRESFGSEEIPQLCHAVQLRLSPSTHTVCLPSCAGNTQAFLLSTVGVSAPGPNDAVRDRISMLRARTYC
jgi:hypothetical protein